VAQPRNDRNQAVTQFCLAMEDHRRTEAGRVRNAREFVASFFPYDEARATDKLFHLFPPEVRGPILAGWGIRGGKAALKDSNEKVRDVVHDALVAGDIDEAIFEEGVTAQILVDWIGLGDWWAFWRSGKLTAHAIQKALATARALDLIDDRWFLANLQSRSGKLKGTDVICDTLSKDQVVAWLRKIHESGDGSPAGLVAALGWETILTKTAQDGLLFALDAFAKKAGFVIEAPPSTKKAQATDAAPISDPVPSASPHEARTDVPKEPDSGVPVAIPDIPAIDAAESVEDTAHEGGLWTGGGESPKLFEARAKMMEMLGTPGNGQSAGYSSEVPEKPSGLDWSEPASDKGKGPAAPRR
jgi:hypothetical protein